MEEQIRDKNTGVSLSGTTVPGTPVGDGKNGLLHVASAAEIEKAKAAADKAEAAAEIENQKPPLKRLELYLSNIFSDCRKFKEDETDIQATMLDSLNRRNSKYDSEKMGKIKQAGSSDVFIGLTGVKCRAFESWVHDIYMNAKRKRTWDLKPTPIVDLPPSEQKRIIANVMEKYEEALESGEEINSRDAYELASSMRAEIISAEYAKAGEKSENMSRKIHDQLVEGGWIKAFSAAMMDLSSSKACVIKGPIVRRRKVKSGWEKASDGRMIPKVEMVDISTFERVSPLDIYPGRTNETTDDGPLCERVTISRESLVANREEPGYIKKNIEYVAVNSTGLPKADSTAHQTERDEAERRDHRNPAPTIGPSLSGIEYWSKCPGRDIVEFGITRDLDNEPIDPLMDYDINAITVDGTIVYLTLNDDILGRRPYSVYGYAKEIGGFWFMGIPELIKSEQDIANASARSLVNNLGIASGPQVIIPDINRLPDGQNITSLHPWKIWQGTNMGNTTAPLVDFFQPDSRAAELLNVLNAAVRMTDQTIELPSYSYGNDKVAGAGRTASGLSMLMGSSNRGLKRILLGIDRYIFQTIVERQYDWNMRNLDDDSIKGDMNFISEGIVSMIMREQLSQSRLGLLEATNNEFDMKILGLDGRAKILGDAIEALESDYDDIKPTEDKINRLIQEESILQQQQIEKNQIEIEKEKQLAEREGQLQLEEIELAKQKLIIEASKIEKEDAATHRELDIRASKQSTGMVEKILESEEQKDAGKA